jgi:hypothetical protein
LLSKDRLAALDQDCTANSSFARSHLDTNAFILLLRFKFGGQEFSYDVYVRSCV